MTRLRVRRSTTTLPNGTRVTTQKVVAAPVLEWTIQAEAVRRLKAMPEYAETAEQVRPGSFTLAADMNAARRSKQEAVKAKATGIAAGDPDLRLYAYGARLLMIEYKGELGRLNDAQKDRHPLLRALGYTVEVVKAATPEEGAAATLALVRGWLALGAAANDNEVWREAATG